MIQTIRAWIERLFHSRVAECTLLRVVDAHAITSHMLRISFTGQDLDAFATDENLHVKLLLPPDGAPRDRWLTAHRDGKAKLRGKGLEPLFRKYTIRAIDAHTGRVVIDFVRHEDGGPGAAWAAAARPGDIVGMIGPGGRGLALADWYFLAGDETALPAIARMLETMPASARGYALIEIANASEEQLLAKPDGVELRWLHRGNASPGTTSLLLDAIASMSWPNRDGTIFVWVAAEFAVTQRIRRHLRVERGLGKQEQMVVAYWRRGVFDAGREK